MHTAMDGQFGALAATPEPSELAADARFPFGVLDLVADVALQ